MRITFLVACVLALLAGRVAAEGQLTLVNAHTQVAFKTYALKVNEFRYAIGQNHDDLDTLRICEAIDNSRLMIIGMRDSETFRETGAFLFGTSAVATSLDAFFRRGGMMYFEPGSWSVYNSWAEAASKFFSAHGVTLPDGSCYVNPAKDRDVNIDGKVRGKGMDGCSASRAIWGFCGPYVISGCRGDQLRNIRGVEGRRTLADGTARI